MRWELLGDGACRVDLDAEGEEIVAELPSEKCHQLRHRQLEGLHFRRMPYHRQEFLVSRLAGIAVSHSACQDMLLGICLLVSYPGSGEAIYIDSLAMFLSLLGILGHFLPDTIVVEAESR